MPALAARQTQRLPPLHSRAHALRAQADGRYDARVAVGGVTVELGTYATEDGAAHAVDSVLVGCCGSAGAYVRVIVASRAAVACHAAHTAATHRTVCAVAPWLAKPHNLARLMESYWPNDVDEVPDLAVTARRPHDEPIDHNVAPVLRAWPSATGAPLPMKLGTGRPPGASAGVVHDDARRAASRSAASSGIPAYAAHGALSGPSAVQSRASAGMATTAVGGATGAERSGVARPTTAVAAAASSAGSAAPSSPVVAASMSSHRAGTGAGAGPGDSGGHAPRPLAGAADTVATFVSAREWALVAPATDGDPPGIAGVKRGRADADAAAAPAAKRAALDGDGSGQRVALERAREAEVGGEAQPGSNSDTEVDEG